MATTKTPKSMTTTDGSCPACKVLSRMGGMKCNAHRAGTENKVDEMIRRAREAGHVFTGTKIEQAMAAEKALGLSGIRLG